MDPTDESSAVSVRVLKIRERLARPGAMNKDARSSPGYERPGLRLRVEIGTVTPPAAERHACGASHGGPRPATAWRFCSAGADAAAEPELALPRGPRCHRGCRHRQNKSPGLGPRRLRVLREGNSPTQVRRRQRLLTERSGLRDSRSTTCARFSGRATRLSRGRRAVPHVMPLFVKIAPVWPTRTSSSSS